MVRCSIPASSKSRSFDQRGRAAEVSGQRSEVSGQKMTNVKWSSGMITPPQLES